MRVGLVLEGGAMRGLYTAGVLDVFLDENIPIDGIVAVSAGALFGVNYPSKQKGRALRYNLNYLKDKRYMGLHSLLTTGNIVNKEFAYYEVPFNLDRFDEQAFKQSDIDFYATVTNLNTGLAEYKKITSVLEQMEVLRASSAMPLVSKIVELDHQPYLDGGIADSIPLSKAQSLGFDRLIVILTRPLEYRKKSSSSRLYERVYRTYPKFVQTWKNRAKQYNDTVEKIINLEAKGDIFVIRPSKTLPIKRLEKNLSKVQAMYDLGILDTKRVMEDVWNYLKEK